LFIEQDAFSTTQRARERSVIEGRGWGFMESSIVVTVPEAVATGPWAPLEARCL